MATGSVLKTFMVKGEKTLHRMKSEPKPPSERDMQIYELHKARKTAQDVGEIFGVSESWVRVIYWALKKRTKS